MPVQKISNATSFVEQFLARFSRSREIIQPRACTVSVFLIGLTHARGIPEMFTEPLFLGILKPEAPRPFLSISFCSAILLFHFLSASPSFLVLSRDASSTSFYLLHNGRRGAPSEEGIWWVTRGEGGGKEKGKISRQVDNLYTHSSGVGKARQSVTSKRSILRKKKRKRKKK